MKNLLASVKARMVLLVVLLIIVSIIGYQASLNLRGANGGSVNGSSASSFSLPDICKGERCYSCCIAIAGNNADDCSKACAADSSSSLPLCPPDRINSSDGTCKCRQDGEDTGGPDKGCYADPTPSGCVCADQPGRINPETGEIEVGYRICQPKPYCSSSSPGTGGTGGGGIGGTAGTTGGNGTTGGGSAGSTPMQTPPPTTGGGGGATTGGGTTAGTTGGGGATAGTGGGGTATTGGTTGTTGTTGIAVPPTIIPPTIIPPTIVPPSSAGSNGSRASSINSSFSLSCGTCPLLPSPIPGNCTVVILNQACSCPTLVCTGSPASSSVSSVSSVSSAATTQTPPIQTPPFSSLSSAASTQSSQSSNASGASSKSSSSVSSNASNSNSSSSASSTVSSSSSSKSVSYSCKPGLTMYANKYTCTNVCAQLSSRSSVSSSSSSSKSGSSSRSSSSSSVFPTFSSSASTSSASSWSARFSSSSRSSSASPVVIISSARSSSLKSSSMTASSASSILAARYCGDGRIDAGEQCDDGSSNGLPNGNCTVTCQLRKLLSCGDAKLDLGEECDNGLLNGRTGNTCSAECRWTVGSCGDGVLQTALREQCDLGKQQNGKAGQPCTNNCQIAPTGHCGNASVEPEYSEQCDDGTNNSDTHPSACRLNCTYPRCGDGVQDYNEECDDGNQLSRDGCSATCEIESGAAPLDGNLMNSSQPYYGNVPQPGRTESGPGLVIFLASGAAAGVGIVRRRLFGAKK